MVKHFRIEQLPKTPLIACDPETGIIHIHGGSLPENAVQFYQPLFDWLDLFIQNPVKLITLDIQLDYFSTSTAKVLVDLFRKLEGFQQIKKTEILINWHYNKEDLDMLEAGEDYGTFIKLNFVMIPYSGLF